MEDAKEYLHKSVLLKYELESVGRWSCFGKTVWRKAQHKRSGKPVAVCALKIICSESMVNAEARDAMQLNDVAVRVAAQHPSVLSVCDMYYVPSKGIANVITDKMGT